MAYFLVPIPSLLFGRLNQVMPDARLEAWDRHSKHVGSRISQSLRLHLSIGRTSSCVPCEINRYGFLPPGWCHKTRENALYGEQVTVGDADTERMRPPRSPHCTYVI